MSPWVMWLRWSSCLGNLLRKSLVLNCPLDRGVYEIISKGLEVLGVPHYLRNRPVLNANEAGSAVRVMSIHTAKGDEAENSALVVISATDRSMISDDPKLEYVALTRAKINSYPRVTN